jgi:hypothetical protein
MGTYQPTTNLQTLCAVVAVTPVSGPPRSDRSAPPPIAPARGIASSTVRSVQRGECCRRLNGSGQRRFASHGVVAMRVRSRAPRCLTIICFKSSDKGAVLRGNRSYFNHTRQASALAGTTINSSLAIPGVILAAVPGTTFPSQGSTSNLTQVGPTLTEVGLTPSMDTGEGPRLLTRTVTSIGSLPSSSSNPLASMATNSTWTGHGAGHGTTVAATSAAMSPAASRRTCRRRGRRRVAGDCIQLGQSHSPQGRWVAKLGSSLAQADYPFRDQPGRYGRLRKALASGLSMTRPASPS